MNKIRWSASNKISVERYFFQLNTEMLFLRNLNVKYKYTQLWKSSLTCKLKGHLHF